MKITVDLSDNELNEIQQLTKESRKGAAIKQMALEGLQIAKRNELLGKFVSGEWSAELPSLKELRKERHHS